MLTFGQDEQARAVLSALLDKYADAGLDAFEDINVLRVQPLNEFGTPIEIVKMFGQTVSYVSGENNTQSVINGADVEVTEAVDGAAAEDDGSDLAEIVDLAALSTDETQEDDSEEIAEILEMVLELLEEQEDSSNISIVINTGDSFYFDVGETTVTKMFGQTVSYVTGEDNAQVITNGPVVDELFAA